MLPMGEWVFGLGTPKLDLLSACADNLVGKRKKEKNVKCLINSRHQQNCSQYPLLIPIFLLLSALPCLSFSSLSFPFFLSSFLVF